MTADANKLEMVFLPFVAPGHMIPLVDVGRLFAARGVKVTIITTTHNALIFQKSIDRDIKSGHDINLHILPFPYKEVGLPQGIENFNSTTQDTSPKVFQALTLLRQPIEQFFRDRRPDCIVSDMFYPWTTEFAAQLGVPRLVFHGTSFFSLSVNDSLQRFASHDCVSSDTESFVVSGLPDHIAMTRLQLPDYVRTKIPLSYFMDEIRDAELRSHGVIMNSFYELEPAYAEHFRKAMGRKAWPIGPVSLCLNRDDKAERGHRDVVDAHECLTWLDSKKPKSVLYVSFGSLIYFPVGQLMEIASALEASGNPFIWVVKKRDTEEKWLPDGFEERMMERNMGMIIRGWAPQVLILEHGAIGGFMTHCGWNSLMESVTAGVPVIAWPLYAEQFYNEKLVTQILRNGVAVGVEEWNPLNDEGMTHYVTKEKIEKAVIRLMKSGDEADGIRKRAKELAEKAKMAVEAGGSSYTSCTHLIQELLQLRRS